MSKIIVNRGEDDNVRDQKTKQNKSFYIGSNLSDYGSANIAAVEWLIREREELTPNTLTILRKFSSTMPRVPSNEEKDIKRELFGGGYFVNWSGYGLVIDPGFNFIENFGKYTELSVANVDGILLTHAHSDHTHDFEPLINLIYERNRQGMKREADNFLRKKVDIFLNPTAYNKFQGMLLRMNELEMIIGPTELDLQRPVKLINYLDKHVMTIHPQKAEHEDSYGTGCMGLTIDLLNMTNPNEVECAIGITSDTGWYEGIYDAYRTKQGNGVNVLVPHVGFIRPYDISAIKDSNADGLRAHIRVKIAEEDNSHLGLCGTFDLVDTVRPDLAILSEFNHQAGPTDLRLFAAVEVQKMTRKATTDGLCGPRCFAGTLGLCIELGKHLRVKCESLGTFVDLHEYRQTVDHQSRRISCCCDIHSDEV